jgi:hypothetical protein
MSNEELIDVAGRHSDLDITVPDGDTTVDGLEPVALDDDPFDDDLESKLQARAPLPITKLTVGLASLVLVVAGFLGGVLVQKNFGSSSNSNSGAGAFNPAALASRAAAGGFGNRGNGGGGTGTATGSGTGGGGTTGTVTLVDGTTVYVTTSTGDVVIVHTGTNTAVQATQTEAVKDIKVGSTVTVTGSTASDGSVTATRITQQSK